MDRSEVYQINIYADEETRERFRRFCAVREWTYVEGLKALLDFTEEVRDDPRRAKSLLKEYKLERIVE